MRVDPEHSFIIGPARINTHVEDLSRIGSKLEILFFNEHLSHENVVRREAAARTTIDNYDTESVVYYH